MGISTHTVHLATRHEDKSTLIRIGDVELEIKSILVKADTIVLVADHDTYQLNEIVKAFSKHCDRDINDVKEIYTKSKCLECAGLAFEVAIVLQEYKDKIEAQQLEIEKLKLKQNDT